MKLLELAKLNLLAYINVFELIQHISKENGTPVNQTAMFLLSQKVDAELPTFDCSDCYVVYNNDEFNWGTFDLTHGLLHDVKNYIPFDDYEIRDMDLINKYKSKYWEIGDVCKLEVFQQLEIIPFILKQKVLGIVKYRGNAQHLFDHESLNNGDMAEIISGIADSPYSLPERRSIKHFTCLEFIRECQKINLLSNEVVISKNEFKKFLTDQNIIIPNYNSEPIVEPEQAKYIWDNEYILLLNKELDVVEAHDIGGFLESDEALIPEPVDKFGTPVISMPEASHYQAERDQYKQLCEHQQAKIEQLNASIAELEAIQTSASESKLSTREENNILRVIAVLGEMDKVNMLKPHEAHGIMARKAELLGINPFPSDESIKKWFTKANEYKKS